MRDERVTDEWLYKYMPIVDEAMLKELEHRAENICEPSESLNLRMEKLLEEKPDRPKAFPGFMKKVSAAAACIVCMLFFAIAGEGTDPVSGPGTTKEEGAGESTESIYSGYFVNPAGLLCTINAAASEQSVEGTVTVYGADGNSITSDIIYVTEGTVVVNGNGSVYQQFGIANGTFRAELVFDENGGYLFKGLTFQK